MPLDIVKRGARLLKNQDVDTVVRTGLGQVSRHIRPTEEPQHAYMWEVSFEGMFQDDAKHLTFYAMSTGIPALRTEPIKRYYAGVPYAYSGKDMSPRLFRVTFWDNQNLEVYHYFQKWFFTMNDPKLHAKVRPEFYMRNIRLRLKDKSDMMITEDFVFKYAFPTEIAEATMNYDNSEAVNFDVVFEFSERTSGVGGGDSKGNEDGGSSIGDAIDGARDSVVDSVNNTVGGFFE